MRSENPEARASFRKRTAALGNARMIAMKRKEEYLGARVPKDLRAKVIQRAEELGIPVSILIRDVLMAAFGDTRAGATLGGRKPETRAEYIPKTDLSSVLGWDEMRLHKPVDCAGCGVHLVPGSKVTFGISEGGARHVVLCNHCKDAV